MIDARRMECIARYYFWIKKETRAEIIDEDSFGELTGPVYFVGDCSEKAQTVLIKENFTFLEEIKYPLLIRWVSFESIK
jgi:tRNA threonylcarbamoyladenosine biosynthesis protein TsaB